MKPLTHDMSQSSGADDTLLLDATNLVKRYGSGSKQVSAVDGVSLTLRVGESLGIVGESGCGKSTLARMLIGLEEPTEGSVSVSGTELKKLRGRRLREARRDIQMVFQDPFTALNPRMTVGDIVGEPFEIHSTLVAKQDRRARVKELLDLVGLSPDHINRFPHQFSGGQRQRIGIARALALNPKVIVCDEPVAALDVSVQAQVVNLLSRLQRDFGISYVFVAHDLSVVRHISQRVAVMYLGKIVEVGTREEIFNNPRHPYTKALISAIPIPDPTRRGERPMLLEGEVPSPTNVPSGCGFRTRCWKATEHCALVSPQLRQDDNSQSFACHFPVGEAGIDRDPVEIVQHG